MPEIVECLGRAEASSERTDPATQARNGPLSGLAQVRLEFAERHLDRSQVVLGQITKHRAPGFDRFAYAGNFVCRKIVHDHDVFAFDRGSERLLDICEERLSAHRAIDHARRRHPIPAQAGYEGKGFPVSLRYAANQSLAARAPAAQPDHFRIGRGLVDEHQSGGIKHGLPSLPASTCPGHVRAILLRGTQAFFEADVVALEESPHGSATACDPVLVHGRDHLIQCQIRLFLDQREQPLRVCLQWRRAPAARLGCATPGLAKPFTHLTAALGLMSSCSAASRREAPPSTRAITRMRMSTEYAFGMVRPPDESMPPDSPIYRSLGILRFYSARTCSSSFR